MITKYEKANKGKLLVAVLALFVVLAGAAVVFSDSEADAASGETTYISGGITAGTASAVNNQSYTGDSKVIVNDDLVIPKYAMLTIDGASLTINEGVTVTVEAGGQIVFKNNAKVNINGTLEAEGQFEAAVITDETNKYVGAIVNDTTYNAADKTGVVLSGALSVTDDATFVASSSSLSPGQLFVKSGATVTVEDGAMISKQTIILDNNAIFTFNGITDNIDGVTVQMNVPTNNYTSTTATIKAGSGAENKDFSDLTFTASSKNITGYTWDSVSSKVDSQVVKQFQLTISGTIDNKDTLDLEDASATLEDVYTSEDYAKTYKDGTGFTYYTYDSKVVGKAVITDLDVNKSSTLTNNAYVIVNGTIDIAEATKGAEDQGIITVNGTFEIVGKVTLDNASLAGTTGTVAINGGSVEVTGGEIGTNYFLYGAVYIADDADDTMHVTSLENALSEAVTAGADKVYVFATPGSETATNKIGSYVISSDITIPDNIEFVVNNGLIIDEGATVTVSADVKFDFGYPADLGCSGMIYVDGKIIDNSRELEDDEANMIFEVKIVTGEGRNEVNTYTTLKSALAETAEGTIYLYNTVNVEGTLTIPANVTVQFADDLASPADEANIVLADKATLVVDGTLIITGSHVLDADANGAKVTVNNVIKTGTETTNVQGTIAGAHFNEAFENDATPYDYITSVAFAATNSANIDTSSLTPLKIIGGVSMGDVTFTQGEDNTLIIAVDNDYNGNDNRTLATAGTVTLVGGATFDLSEGAFTGTVAADITSGTSSITFEKSTGAVVAVKTIEGIDASTTSFEMTVDNETIIGNVTISAGEVTFASDVKFAEATDYVPSKLTVASGATLNIASTYTLTLAAPGDVSEFYSNGKFQASNIDEFITENMTFQLDGTMNVSGAVEWGYSVIDGTMNILEDGTMGLTAAIVNGTVSVGEDAGECTVEIVVLYGTLAGDVDINSVSSGAIGGAILVKPGSNTTDAKIVWNDAFNETDAEVSAVYINGELYATVYATSADMPINAIALSANVSGVDKSKTIGYFSDASMDTPIDGAANIGAYPEVYITMEPAIVSGTISSGTGLDLYIDNVRWTGTLNQLTVGEHTVSFDVKTGYTGDSAYIEFNGQKVTDGKITVTGDMKSFTLVASGATPIDYSQAGSSDDSGMGIVEILLVILVVVVVILAIIVVLRMMRS